MSGFEVGLASANSLVSLIEKIFDRLLSIQDRNRRRQEISRLHDLLEQVRIGRTSNWGLIGYASSAIGQIEDDGDTREALELIDQIENSLISLIEIVDTMAEEKDRVVLYDNESFQSLSLVARGRHDLLQELRQLWKTRDGDALVQAMQQYETLSDELGRISHKLASHGRDMDQSLK